MLGEMWAPFEDGTHVWHYRRRSGAEDRPLLPPREALPARPVEPLGAVRGAPLMIGLLIFNGGRAL